MRWRALLLAGLLATTGCEAKIPNPFASPPAKPVNCDIVADIPDAAAYGGAVGPWWPADLSGLTEGAWRFTCIRPGKVLKIFTYTVAAKAPVITLKLSWPCAHVNIGQLMLPRCRYWTPSVGASDARVWRYVALVAVWG